MELYKRVNGVRVKCSEEEAEERKREWAEFDKNAESKRNLERRRNAYPSVQDQLDMIYWDGKLGKTKWQDTISKIKNDFPID